MIQRIQSVWLLLATIVAIVFIFIPYAFSGATSLSAMAFEELLILSGVTAAISFINIFLFRNRRLQIRLTYLNVLALIVLIGLAAFQAIEVAGDDTPYYGAAMPLLGVIFTLLATRSIKGDEKLIDSMNSGRLR